jgi:hypothetical protein
MDIKELNVINNNKKNHPWEYARCKLVADLIKKYIKTGDNDIILDIGSGDAFFLTQFSEKYSNLKLVAVDTAYDDELILFLSEKYKGHAIEFFQTVDDVKITNGRVSLVFLLDVIEHIEDDVNFLKNLLKSNIPPDTFFLITVPAYQYLYCKHDRWLGHYRRYSQKLLKEHVEKAGLHYVSGGYFFTSLLLPRLMQKMIEKLQNDNNGKDTGIGDWNGGKFISGIYEKVLLLDYFFSKLLRCLGIKLPGLSSYAICTSQANKI